MSKISLSVLIFKRESIVCDNKGFPATGNKNLDWSSASGLNRVPLDGPPMSMTAFSVIAMRLCYCVCCFPVGLDHSAAESHPGKPPDA